MCIGWGIFSPGWVAAFVFCSVLRLLNWSSLLSYCDTPFSFNLSAYLRVFRVWSPDEIPGQTHASIMILTLSLARKESLSTKVNLLYLKGTCCPYVAWPFWESIALTHSLSPRRDLLISAPSILLSLSFSSQSPALSLPARSTRSSLPLFLTPSS